MELRSKLPSLEDYYRVLADLLDAKSTHIYIDTSFLMWLSHLGSSSRTEFFSWVDEIGRNRFHVPLWASHEYHQHFVDSTISKNTKEYISKLNQAARNFYSALQPAIVEANAPPRWNSDQIKNDTRQAILELLKTSNVIESWCDETWDERSAAVIDFINQCCLKSGNTFEYLKTIGQTTDNRFSGRVPPGFQDRIKKDTQEVGGNRAGDLMFWKEILDHARSANRFPPHGVKSIIVLTNDGKSDWIEGGKPTRDGTIEAFRINQNDDSVPIIHPMLEHEARTYSKVRRVILMNSFALGMHFHYVKRAPTFVEVTISIRMPKYNGKEPVLKKADKDSKVAFVAETAKPSVPIHPSGIVSHEDSPGRTEEQLMAPLTLTTYALSAVTEGTAGVGVIINEMLSVAGAAKPITDWLTEDLLVEENSKRLIWIGRLLAERAIREDSNATTRIVDLLAVLKDIGASAASKLYTGILFGIYFDNSNQHRTTPRPEFLQTVFKFQKESFAGPGLIALSNAFPAEEDQPVYLPTSKCSEIMAEVNITAVGKTSSLSALVIGDTNFLTHVGENDARALYNFLGLKNSKLKKEVVTIHDLILCAARALGFPTQQITIKNKTNQEITIAITDGLDIIMNGGGFDAQ